jgi:hypothetical protein
VGKAHSEMIRGKTREEKSDGAIRRGSGILNRLTFGLLGKDQSSHVIVKPGERDLAPIHGQKGRESVSGRTFRLSREQSPPADERLLPTIASHDGYSRGVKVYPHQRKRENLSSNTNAVSISRMSDNRVLTATTEKRVIAPVTKNKGGVLCCDKCDGNHDTHSCPHFSKVRDSHPDGQKNFYKKLGGESSLPGSILRTAKVIRQPGDGSCLFHSMSYGIGTNATVLRGEICEFIRNHPNFKICDTPLSDWVKWDSGSTCKDYARKMSRGSWGGGIEMAVCSQIQKVNIHVYERTISSFKRISAFDYSHNPTGKTIVRVLYQGGVYVCVHLACLLLPYSLFASILTNLLFFIMKSL